MSYASRAMGESVLEVHFWMIFRYVVLAGPLGRAFGGVFVFWGGCCVDSCSAAGPLGTTFWRWQCRSCTTIMGPKVDEVGPKMAPTQP